MDMGHRVASKFGREGTLTSRAIRRHDGQCREPTGGGLLILSLIPNIGEPISLNRNGRGCVSGPVCWVKDGKVGITFAEPRE